jgi:tetratricopeptide (TPR) repeat protein
MALVHARRRILENFAVVWFNQNVDQSSNDYQHSLSQLRQIIPSIEVFTYVDDCIDYLNEIKNEKVFLIVSDLPGQELVPIIQDIPSLYAIYVLCSDPMMVEPSITEYTKVKSIFTQIKSLCDRLKQDLYLTDHNLTPISILSPGLPTDLNQLDQSFMYSQLLKEILLKMTNDDDAKKDFVQFCREQCSENDARLSVIEEFERSYDPTLAIRWYTRDCFIYSMLNKALRTQEIDIIIKMGFFIRDLHRRIEQLYSSVSYAKPLILYRGQGMNSTEFEKLCKSKGGLLSFNSFLSTSFDEKVGLLYADSAQQNPELTGVLFQIDISPQIISTPFASIRELSYFEDAEEEILFSMHTIFRIVEMNTVDNSLWKVKLVSTTDHDEDLKQLTDFIRQDIDQKTESMQLVDLMIEMGEYNKAEEIYRATHNIDAVDDDEAVQCDMGFLMTKKGNTKLALSFYEKALEIQEKSLPTNHLDIASSHNNVGAAHVSMGEYSIALDHFNKALTIQKQLLPESHFDLARTYNDIGATYRSIGDYPKSLDYLKKALVISQKHLPQNHPNLAKEHNNIATVLQAVGDYSTALTNYEKTLEIQRRILPPNHPDLAATYNNISEIHRIMGRWSTALTFCQKALEIQEKLSIPNHPSLAVFHNNIAEINRLMGNYPDALSHLEQALLIQQDSLLKNYPELVKIYNNMGLVYESLKNHSAALEQYEKAFRIQEKILPPDHPDFASLHNNIALLYQSMGDYTKALAQFDKTLQIRQQCLSEDHPELGSIHNNIGVLHLNLGHYSNALPHLEQAAEIWQKSFPPNHPYLSQLHSGLSGVYFTLNRYDDAMRHSLLALGITSPTSNSARQQPQMPKVDLD